MIETNDLKKLPTDDTPLTPSEQYFMNMYLNEEPIQASPSNSSAPSSNQPPPNPSSSTPSSSSPSNTPSSSSSSTTPSDKVGRIQQFIHDMKTPLILGCFFFILNSSQVNGFLQSVYPYSKNSEVMLLLIKTLVFIILLYVYNHLSIVQK